MNNKELKIEEGSINFWIKENAIDFSDGKSTPIVTVNPTGGSILCVKDDDNKIKFFFVVIGKGRVDIEFDVNGLSSERRHMVTFTWSLKENELNFYFNGKKEVTKSLDFNSARDTIES